MMADSASPGGRFQVGLRALTMAVLGSAFVLDVARRSRVAWGGSLPDADHALGLVVLALAVSLTLVVAGQSSRRLRDRGGAWAWGLAWRVASMGWLVWSAAELSRTLQVDWAAMIWMSVEGLHARMRLRVVPLATAFGMVGLVLATTPLRPRALAPAHRAGWSWPSVVLAGLAGVVVVAMLSGLYPYLVLLAIDAMENAMRRAPLVSRPPMVDRLAWAGLESIPGLAACLATGIWVNGDLRAAARDPVEARAPRSWAGVIARLATAALAAAGGAYLVLASVPRLGPAVGEGISSLIDPATAGAVALGFAGLAGGISARSAARLAIGGASAGPPVAPATAERNLGAWPRRVLGAVACLVAAELTAATIQAIRRDLEDRWYIPISLDTWMEFFRAPVSWLFPAMPIGWSRLIDRPGDALVMAAAVWLAVRLAGLLVGKGTGRPSPLDFLAGDRLALGRFLGWWAGLITLMLASLPVLGVAGVALTHLMVRWAAG
jgi:hypothetical protein